MLRKLTSTPALKPLFFLNPACACRLGSLQENPAAGTVFGTISERIRADLGAEAAAVYIDVGDGNLWMLPHGNKSNRIDGEIFVQRGVGVVGLVAMGALPGGAAASQSSPYSDGRGVAFSEDGDGVEVLLLNDGLEAFDNSTTVEAALLRAARGLPDRCDAGSAMVDAGSTSGTVRNMLVAR